MNPAHIHLLVNHLPIIGSFVGVPLVALALWKRQELGALRAAALVLAIAAVGAGVANSTGEGAEERIEDSGWASERLIHEHEERADVATPIAVLTGVAAVAALIWSERKKAVNPAIVGALGLLSLASAGSMAWVGAAGGVIRHDEIRDGATVTQPGAGAGGAEAGERGGGGQDDDGDDD